MDLKIKEQFMEDWAKHFPNCDLPIVCFYSNKLNGVNFPSAPKPRPEGFTCIFSQLAAVKAGKPRAFNKKNLGCFGSFLPFGFDSEVLEDVKNYVCNIERVKKSYEHFTGIYKHRPLKQAPGEYLIFKRWDTIEEQDKPQVVFFLGNQDVITGLHGLANFDALTPYEVIAPFGTGCDSIVGYPMNELCSENPKAVMGPLDIAVRKFFKPNILTFSVPWPKFQSMLTNMNDSFLNTDSWEYLKKRFSKNKNG